MPLYALCFLSCVIHKIVCHPLFTIDVILHHGCIVELTSTTPVCSQVATMPGMMPGQQDLDSKTLIDLHTEVRYAAQLVAGLYLNLTLGLTTECNMLCNKVNMTANFSMNSRNATANYELVSSCTCSCCGSHINCADHLALPLT